MMKKAKVLTTPRRVGKTERVCVLGALAAWTKDQAQRIFWDRRGERLHMGMGPLKAVYTWNAAGTQSLIRHLETDAAYRTKNGRAFLGRIREAIKAGEDYPTVDPIEAKGGKVVSGGVEHGLEQAGAHLDDICSLPAYAVADYDKVGVDLTEAVRRAGGRILARNGMVSVGDHEYTVTEAAALVDGLSRVPSMLLKDKERDMDLVMAAIRDAISQGVSRSTDGGLEARVRRLVRQALQEDRMDRLVCPDDEVSPAGLCRVK
jgi:hypothetical protein